MIVRDTAFLAHLPSASPASPSRARPHARRRGGDDRPCRGGACGRGSRPTLERGGAAGLLALAYWTRGDLDAAYAAWTESFESLKAAGRTADLLGLSIAMADIRIDPGSSRRRAVDPRARSADRDRSEASPLRGTADMHVGLSEIDRERNDLPSARRHLEAAESLGRSDGPPQNPYRLRVARARIAFAGGRLDEAVRAAR